MQLRARKENRHLTHYLKIMQLVHRKMKRKSDTETLNFELYLQCSLLRVHNTLIPLITSNVGDVVKK